MRFGQADRRDDVRVVVLGPVGLEVEGANRLAAGSAEQAVRSKTSSSPSSSIMPSATSSAATRPTAGVNGLSGGSFRCPASVGPVEVEARGVARGRVLERRLVGARERQPGRRHQRLLRAGHHHVEVPLVLGIGTAPSPGHRVHRDQGPMAVGHLAELPDVVDHAGGGLREGGEHHLHLGVLAEHAVQAGRVDLAAPLGLPVDRLAAVGVDSSAQRSPNLPQEATSAGFPRLTRLAAADSSAPVPEAAKIRTSFWVTNTSFRRRRTRA